MERLDQSWNIGSILAMTTMEICTMVRRRCRRRDPATHPDINSVPKTNKPLQHCWPSLEGTVSQIRGNWAWCYIPAFLLYSTEADSQPTCGQSRDLHEHAV